MGRFLIRSEKNTFSEKVYCLKLLFLTDYFNLRIFQQQCIFVVFHFFKFFYGLGKNHFFFENPEYESMFLPSKRVTNSGHFALNELGEGVAKVGRRPG